MITLIVLVSSLIALLYYRAESLDIRFAKVVAEYEDVEDPHAELFWGSDIYRLNVDHTRIVDSETGKSFPATRDEIADIKFRTRHGALTCDSCINHSCSFRGDTYNTNGDCLNK
jgi:hypothetical protein